MLVLPVKIPPNRSVFLSGVCYQIFTIILKSHSEAERLASHRFCYSWLVEVFATLAASLQAFY